MSPETRVVIPTKFIAVYADKSDPINVEFSTVEMDSQYCPGCCNSVICSTQKMVLARRARHSFVCFECGKNIELDFYIMHSGADAVSIPDYCYCYPLVHYVRWMHCPHCSQIAWNARRAKEDR